MGVEELTDLHDMHIMICVFVSLNMRRAVSSKCTSSVSDSLNSRCNNKDEKIKTYLLFRFIQKNLQLNKNI